MSGDGQASSGAGGAGDSRDAIRATVVTVSTSRTAGEAADEGGPRLAQALEATGIQVTEQRTVPDDWDGIAAALRDLAHDADLIATTGGTGFSPDDVTPEATREVIEREAPGIAEAMRLASRDATPNWMLSRNVAGVHNGALIINFPGSPKAIDETWGAIAGPVAHAVAPLRGDRPAH